MTVQSLFQKIPAVLQEAKVSPHCVIITQLSKYWIYGSMHQIHKTNYKECFDTDQNIHLVLLQLGPILIGSGMPSPATLLFNGHIRRPLAKLNRTPMLCNCDNDHYAFLKQR